MNSTYGPAFRWFAWHPTETTDRGWRWLRTVNRRRVWWDAADWGYSGKYFQTSVEEFDD